MSKPTVVKLSKPLITHKGEVTELELKTPTVRAFRKHGDPVKLIADKSGAIRSEYNNESVVAFLSDMTGVEESILDDLPAPDFFKLRANLEAIIFGITGTGANSESPLE